MYVSLNVVLSVFASLAPLNARNVIGNVGASMVLLVHGVISVMWRQSRNGRDGLGYAWAVIVFHNKAIIDVVIEWDQGLGLGVLAKPLPPIPTGATKGARGVGNASVF